MADIVDIFKCLGKIIRRIHTILAKGGKNALKEELQINSNNLSNQFELVQRAMVKWDDVLKELNNVAIQLEKGDADKVIIVCKNLARSISNLQCFIVGTFVEIGSFVPGPIGVVCSLVLAIGCFATGNILGGFLNLLGAIPFAKCTKFLSRADFRRIITESGLSKFEPKGSYLTWKIPNISQLQNYALVFSKNFSSVFEKSLKTTKDAKIIEGIKSYGKKTPSSISHVGSPNTILGKSDDGWNTAREELIGEKSFELGFWNK